MLLINTKVTVGNEYIYGEYICCYIFMVVICLISQFAKKDGNIAAGRHSVINFVNWLRVFFYLIFLSEKDVMMNRNAEKTVIKGLFRLIKIASMYTMSVF
ncbi:hypothetical protein MF905_004320 [Salmonella enterica subsp. enterica serovar Newport]|nr:hypothetical protein [Salmonella enterica subsp. enterica serovar Newport]EIW7081999.1 hypothetical protein [Salmonella enterica subsp. enterica serovar Newport]